MLEETRREATMRVIGDKIKTFDRVEKAFLYQHYYVGNYFSNWDCLFANKALTSSIRNG